MYFGGFFLRICVQSCEGIWDHIHRGPWEGFCVRCYPEEGPGEYASSCFSSEICVCVYVFVCFNLLGFCCETKLMQDKLLDQTSVSHLFPITKYLGLLATGMTGLS